MATGCFTADSCRQCAEKIGREILRFHPSVLDDNIRPNEKGAWGRAIKMPEISMRTGDATQLHSQKFWRSIYNYLIHGKVQLPPWGYRLEMHLTRPMTIRQKENPAGENYRGFRYVPQEATAREMRDSFFQWIQRLVDRLWRRLDDCDSLEDAITLLHHMTKIQLTTAGKRSNRYDGSMRQSLLCPWGTSARRSKILTILRATHLCAAHGSMAGMWPTGGAIRPLW